MNESTKYQASVIISVYKDVENLNAILSALSHQSVSPSLEVIVSEDGDSDIMKQFVDSYSNHKFAIRHLTQDDNGFRKNRALNRAIAEARSERLLFLDGDCVPHARWLESHISNLAPKILCVGRRVELGPRLSRRLKSDPDWLKKLSRPWYYLALTFTALFDKAHHYEAGIRSRILFLMTKNKKAALLGCNFSCYRNDLLAVNGFNESYVSPGYGEDCDIEWRLHANNVRSVNLKFLAQVFHLYHAKSYAVTQTNRDLFEKTKSGASITCQPGIDQYLTRKAD